MVLLRILLVLVGLTWIGLGIQWVRVWRKADGSENGYLRAAVGGQAVSRLLGGLVLIAGSVALEWQVIAAGAACLLLGNVGMGAARRRLERHP